MKKILISFILTAFLISCSDKNGRVAGNYSPKDLEIVQGQLKMYNPSLYETISLDSVVQEQWIKPDINFDGRRITADFHMKNKNGQEVKKLMIILVTKQDSVFNTIQE